LEVADLGKHQRIILGLPWLRCHNPTIDWSSGVIHFNKCLPDHHLMRARVVESEEGSIRTLRGPISLEGPGSALWDQGQSTSVREDMEKFVPLHFWDFEDVFTHTTFNSLLAHSSFDHQINLEESFIPQRGKVYALSP
jgi:hypothetical protein